MLSHRNLISAMSSLINIAQFKPNDRYIGYLPLAHVLELLAETSCLLYGIKVGYRLVILDFENSPDVKFIFLGTYLYQLLAFNIFSARQIPLQIKVQKLKLELKEMLIY